MSDPGRIERLENIVETLIEFLEPMMQTGDAEILLKMLGLEATSASQNERTCENSESSSL